jgi:uncharacterized surface protein with fasciclin (FAS1) repeats
MKFAAVLSTFMLAASQGVVADECQSIVDLVCGSKDLKNFCDLISSTGLEDMYGESDMTVFAPVDSAIQRLDSSALEDEKLQEIVMYHAHKGALRTDDIECYAGYNMIQMMSGKDSRTVCVDFEPTFQKGGGNSKEFRPRILSSNLEACNGVVHTLDTVMLPNGIDETVVLTKAADGTKLSAGAHVRAGWFGVAAAAIALVASSL